MFKLSMILLPFTNSGSLNGPTKLLTVYFLFFFFNHYWESKLKHTMNLSAVAGVALVTIQFKAMYCIIIVITIVALV